MSLEKLGPYRLEKQLGHGGMGAVYSGVHEETGARAAIKVLNAIQGSNESLRIRFDAEIESLKTLKHPKIVQLFGYGEQDGHLFYAMELIDGKSLHDELRTGRVFKWRDVTRLSIEICAALKHAHDSGVIHRDLKPANLLLTPDGHVKLADFGIAKLFGSTQVTVTGGIVGTADFMSPEQADGLPITARSDLYSLGSVMYALLARRPPFTGRTVSQIIHSLKYETPIQLRRLAPDTPIELETLVHQLLEKDPQKRVPTALVLSNRLRALEHGIPLQDPVADADFLEGGGGYQIVDDPLDGGLPTRTMHPNKPTQQTRKGSKEAPQSSAAAGEATQIHVPSNPGQRSSGNAGSRSTTPASFASSISRFTTVSEEEIRRSLEGKEENESAWPEWIKPAAIGGACLVVAGLVWVARKPPSPDVMFEKISTIAQTGDYVKLEDYETEMEKFLRIYADDPRAAEVEGWKNEIDQQRKARQLARAARRQGNVESNGLAERAFIAAREMATSDPEQAVVKLQAIIDVFDGQKDGDEGTRRAVALARSELQRLENAIQRRQADDITELQKQLDWAADKQAEDVEAARAVWRGIVELFSNKAWAADIVQKCQKALRETDTGK